MERIFSLICFMCALHQVIALKGVNVCEGEITVMVDVTLPITKMVRRNTNFCCRFTPTGRCAVTCVTSTYTVMSTTMIVQEARNVTGEVCCDGYEETNNHCTNKCPLTARCINGGQCVADNQCDCTGTGYMGVTCAQDLNECVTSSPCNQTCINTIGSFNCKCDNTCFNQVDKTKCVLKSNKCFIDGICYNNGATSSSGCKVCNPDTSSNEWSNAENEKSCNDGQLCTYNDQCNAGVCTGSLYDCDNDKCDFCKGDGTCEQDQQCMITNFPPPDDITDNPCKSINNANGIPFSDPSDCHKFFQCAHGRAFSKSCPGTLVFDSRYNVCNWPSNVPCNTVVP